MSTPNMGLTLPTVSQTPGPQWASEINSDLSLLDSHDHTTGKGIQVPVAGLNINDDLPLAGIYGVEQARYLELANQSGTIPDASLFRSAGNLFYKNTSGVSVQITSGASVAAPVSSGWSGLSAPAAAIYSGGVFELWEDNSPGNEIAGTIQCGPVAMARASVGAAILTLTPSAAMSSGYVITLPPSEPVSSSVLSMDASGAVTNVLPDGTTVEIVSSTLRVKEEGVNTLQLADNAVTTVKIDDDAVTQAKLGPAVFDQSSSDSGAYSASTPSTGNTEITLLEIPAVTLLAGRPVMVGLQSSSLSPLNNSYLRSQTNHTRLYIQATEPGGGTIILGQTEIDTGAFFPPTSLSAWFIPTVSGSFKFEVFSRGVGGTSTFSVNFCRTYIYQF